MRTKDTLDRLCVDGSRGIFQLLFKYVESGSSGAFAQHTCTLCFRPGGKVTVCNRVVGVVDSAGSFIRSVFADFVG